jgi:hypothetical protein
MFGKKIPFSIEPHKTIEFDLSVTMPRDDSVYDQTATFIVDEEKKMKQYPVRIIASIPNPLSPPSLETSNEQDSEK